MTTSNANLEARNADYLAGISPEMQAIQKVVGEIARTDIPVLLMGESGTGKEIIALRIHGFSAHRERPFVKLGCASFTPDTFQSRLSALHEETNAGTLFLDEISELDSACQRQLLQSIPDGDPAEANSVLKWRFISCTTHDLDADVQFGRFRRELFYRLNHIRLSLPPLRQRKEDIPLLTHFFLKKYARIFDRPEVALSEKAMKVLTGHSWPGNVRELETVVKKIVALQSEELGIADLGARPVSVQAPVVASATKSLKATARAASQQAERQLILQTLEITRWNRKKAAEALQISYKALLYKLKQIYVPDSRKGLDDSLGDRP
jgi:two-component system, NtrC family, response regulator AtoC